MGASVKRTGELIDKGINIVTSDNGKVTINYLISDQGGQGKSRSPGGGRHRTVGGFYLLYRYADIL